MEFNTKALDWAKTSTLAVKSDYLVIGLFELQTLISAAEALDVATKGLVARFVRLGDFEGKRGTPLLLHEVAGVSATRVLLVGLDKEADFIDRAYAEAVRTALRVLASTRAASVTWTLTEHTARDKDTAWAMLTAVTLIREASYHFIERHPELKNKRSRDGAGLRKLVLAVPAADAKTASVATVRGTAITNGMDLMHGLGNLPSNICAPTCLANTTRQTAKDFKLKVEVLGRKRIEALKMGAFLVVTKGSVELPASIVLRYEGGPAKQAPVVLIGKSVTSDTGSISLEPDGGMDEVKYNMYGAVSVLDTLRTVVEVGLKQSVIAVIPTCEDVPSGIVIKPGNVVIDMSGQTIEILNTDAEGRPILCDALTCAERFKPAVVIDVAMLTGACTIALGHINTGMYTRNDALASALITAGKQSLGTAQCMPLNGEYQEQLESNFADMGNISGRPAGSVTAACFLARFTEEYNWTHLDIADTAQKSGAAEGATGRPAPLLTRLLMDRG